MTQSISHGIRLRIQILSLINAAMIQQKVHQTHLLDLMGQKMEVLIVSQSNKELKSIFLSLLLSMTSICLIISIQKTLTLHRLLFSMVMTVLLLTLRRILFQMVNTVSFYSWFLQKRSNTILKSQLRVITQHRGSLKLQTVIYKQLLNSTGLQILLCCQKFSMKTVIKQTSCLMSMSAVQAGFCYQRMRQR